MIAEASSHPLLLLDFDGTLAPIAVSPGLARLPATTRATPERPRVGWNKGTAVRWTRERSGLRDSATFYLGSGAAGSAGRADDRARADDARHPA